MKVVTFGELMLRLQPYNYERFVQCDHVEFTFGGGEANVAVSLANYGMDAAYVTKLPAHAIGQSAVNSLRRYGVDTSMIVRGGDRVGIYFNEKGASQRGSVCIYDRKYSAIQQATTADFDWEKIFEGYESAIVSTLGSFAFNDENVEAECAACSAVMEKYTAELLTGTIDLEEKLPTIKAELEKAGIYDIQKEAQAQLDAYLAGN